MANTFVEYTGNNSTTNYSITFEYLKEAEVKATLDGTATTDFTFANATTLSFNTAPGSGVKIRIYRETDVSALKATFFAGSAIKAEDLNDNFTQNNFAVEELRESTWDFDTETIKSNETWVSSDTQIATTAAMDARFQDEAAETITSSETWPDDDNTIATTAAIDNRIDTAITNDIAGSDGVSITDDGDGTITIGLTDDSVDFDKIKDADQVQLSNQVASPAATHDDNKVFTASAAARRFDNYYQNSAPTTTDGIGVGQVWVDPDDDLTLSVWTGSAWSAITSGGTFTNQPKVVYVDASSGSDDNDGHRISRPKQTIKAAVNQINADSTHGDGSVVIVAAGVYQEAAPIQIQKKNVSIIGQALRSCLVHPTVATQGDQSAGNHALFELNSGSFIQNLTLTGMKAGTGTGNTVDSTLPTNQGWNFAFFSGATITKSPYIQNCTNFSDSEIDNSNLNANTPAGGLAGDTDSAPTGGGMLVDGSVVATSSPLRSMVADSYTHVGLNGPGILVTNNGYAQCTSSYAFFNKYHIKTLNGGQANLAASTTDFGDQGLVADGKSTAAIFTSNVDGAASSGAISFNVNEPTAGSGWFGDTQRPATNMLVEVNSVIYPILSATANTDSEGGSGWTVTISRPDSNNRSTNLGLNGAISDNAAVSFYLRSMIASSGHTMEYVGSGTDYRALPENGGVPDETKQITESNNGKVWTAITDHNGKFKIGGNQTDDPIFQVDQQLGFVTIPEGSIAFNLLSDVTPQLGGNLDVNGNEIVTDASNENIVLNPHGTGSVNVSTSRIINVSNPTDAQDAATKNYVDSISTDVVDDTTPQLGGDLDVNGRKIVSVTNGNVEIEPNGTGSIVLDGNVGIGLANPGTHLVVQQNNIHGANGFHEDDDAAILVKNSATGGKSVIKLDDEAALVYGDGSSNLIFSDLSTERMRIDSSGNVGIRTGSPAFDLHLAANSSGDAKLFIEAGQTAGDDCEIIFGEAGETDSRGRIFYPAGNHFMGFQSNGSERMRITSTGNVGIGTSTPGSKLDVNGEVVFSPNTAGKDTHTFTTNASNDGRYLIKSDTTTNVDIQANGASFFNGGNVGIGTSSPSALLHISNQVNSGDVGLIIQNTGTSSQTASLYLNKGSGGEPDHRIQNDTGGNLTFARGTDESSYTEQMRIDSSGNVGIGTTSPTSKFDVEIATNTGINFTNVGTAPILDFKANSVESAGRIRVNEANGGGIMQFATKTTGDTITERARIDNNGRLLVGLTSARATKASASIPNFQIEGTGDSDSRMSIGRNSNGDNGPEIHLYKTRGTSLGANTVVQNNDFLGTIGFFGADDSDLFSRGAEISAAVDGTPGDDDMPTRLTFGTCADGSAAATERMRISSAGQVGINTTTFADGATGLAVKNGASSSEHTFLDMVCDTNESNRLRFSEDGSTFPGEFKYDTNSHNLSITVNSNERMRIDDQGRVLIGNTSTSNTGRLCVKGNASSATGAGQITIQKGAAVSGADQHIGSLNFGEGSAVTATIKAFTNANWTGASRPTYMTFETTPSSSGSASERMRIRADGKVFVNNTSLNEEGVFNTYSNGSTAAFQATGGSSMSTSSAVAVFDKHANVSTTSQVFINFRINDQQSGSGRINANGASQAAFGSFSDRRLKENIVDLPSQLDNVCRLRPVEFDYIQSEGGGHQTSFIAQEFEEVFPDAVGEREDGMKTLTGWGKTEAILVKALQEAVAKIEILEAKVAALEAG